MDLNYRCIRCRECSACRDSDRTEAISLREEAEMEQIDQSVKLDLQQKQIICTLPLREAVPQFKLQPGIQDLGTAVQALQQSGRD